MDKTVFSAEKIEQQKSDKEYWLSLPDSQRLKALMQMLSINFNFDLQNPPKLDRTVFSMEKRG